MRKINILGRISIMGRVSSSGGRGVGTFPPKTPSFPSKREKRERERERECTLLGNTAFPLKIMSK